LDKSDAFSLENSPSIPCKLCSEKLIEKMQSARIKMRGLKQSVSFRTQREFLVNPKTSSNLTDSAKRRNSDQDPFLKKALEIVIAEGKASTSLLQRKLSIGYAYAAKLIDWMEEMNAVGPYAGAKPREVLWTKMDLMEPPMSFPKEFVGVHFKKEAVLEILDLIETLSDDGDLPELFVRFSGEVLSEDFEAKELFEEFKRLYRETPEQILVTEQRYFMERQLEEQREANEKLLEEQREANRILEEAERQRAREEAYRAEEEQEHNRRMEIYQAKEQCSHCAKRRNCLNAGWKERLCNDFVPR
jgi:DNA segregation ATPase FtsK/SpoIIIE-like protein